MPRVRRSKLAEQDYREIWHYIACDSRDAADRVLRKFDSKLQLPKPDLTQRRQDAERKTAPGGPM
ncbi:MAG TPA: type II toxin-antitoxin system RelE/ParE family toxin [Tepidisphaeraceae bacterium]|jgi:plasmid stabilization system protein ParE|nr:type II toxin-antitoxin system RelE/ParE family toxin [Tepidisphaeraceae bacterium]